MRFASKSQEYNRTVRQPIYTIVQGPAGPEYKPTREPIMAQFEQGGLTQFEKAQCAARFTFLGSAEGEDVMRRVSIYDTDEAANAEGWDADTKREVEENLVAGQNEWYFMLEVKRASKPWPSYSEQTPKQILDTVTTIGANIEDVLAYERENKNRATLIAELQQKITEQEPEPLVAA